MTEHEKQPSQLSFIVKEALKLLRASIPSTIEIKQNIESQSVVLADPTQIHQIVMNLCTNAYHAMRDKGGTLGIGLKDVDVSQEMIITESEVMPGTYVQLEVSDSGCGMDDKTKRKIFEPYFTTKDLGEGTGLGLAVVFGIVESHKGYINIYSEMGQGTTIHVYLPVIDNETNIPLLNKEEQNVMLTGGNEKIMFVDDELDITDFGKSLLIKYGYDVNTFNNGGSALKEFRENQEKYDLIITDMTMPHMTGLELAEKIIEINSDMPIIICTGHSELVNREKAMSVGISEYCEKPLSIKVLLLAVRSVLDKKGLKS
jgi:CheY-like chemotaxis protein